jgi:hypothetical protein
MIPAMFRSEPLGLASALILPLASAYRKITRASASSASSTAVTAKYLPSP